MPTYTVSLLDEKNNRLVSEVTVNARDDIAAGVEVFNKHKDRLKVSIEQIKVVAKFVTKDNVEIENKYSGTIAKPLIELIEKEKEESE